MGLPLLIHILPLRHGIAFPLLAVVAIAATAGLLYAIARMVGAPDRLAAALAILFATSPGMVVVLFRDGRSVDPFDLLALAAAAFFVMRRQTVALALTLVAAALVRESWVVVLPFAYAVWAIRPLDRVAAEKVVAVAAPAATLYVAIRLGISTIGRNQVVGYAGPFFAERWHVVTTALSDWTATLRRSFLALGPLWLVAPLAVRRLRFARAGLAWAALCAVSLTFAADWERVLLVLTPVAYPAAGFVLRRRPRAAVFIVAACMCCNVAYLAYMVASGYRNIVHPKPPAYPVR